MTLIEECIQMLEEQAARQIKSANKFWASPRINKPAGVYLAHFARDRHSESALLLTAANLLRAGEI